MLSDVKRNMYGTFNDRRLIGVTTCIPVNKGITKHVNQCLTVIDIWILKIIRKKLGSKEPQAVTKIVDL